ncbi:uncharacterized protein LOC134828586 [Culicoides brevitarsis]|uniref:uncharacterized protein LOC134828586 n=1 Tax=Culicoides brevitarsis TaxID=469753 RepID=UPI00307B435F
MISLIRAFSASKIGLIQRPCGYLQFLAAAHNKSIYEAAGLPTAPKKPLNAYLRYLKEVRETVVAANPGKITQEVNKLIGEQYKTLEDSKKKEYEDAFKKETEEYHKEREAYLKALTPEMKKKLEIVRKKRRERRFGIEDTEKNPEKPKKAVLIFVREQMKEISKEPNETLRQYMKRIRQKWKSLSAEEKNSYEILSKKEYEEYKKSLEKSKIKPKKSKGNGAKNLYEKANLPSPPKRPLGAYLRYLKKVRPSIAANNPGKSPQEINTLVGEKYRNLDESEKKELQKGFQEEYRQYIIAMYEYRRTLTPAMKLNVETARTERAARRARKTINQRKTALGKPKRPPTAFAVFVGEKLKEIPKEPNKLLKDYIKKIKRKWQKLSETEKNSYIDAAAKNLEKYKVALDEWEREMIAQGHSDVVRNQKRLKKLNKNQESS